MKSSTLHRASLSQERMTMLERAKAMNMTPDTSSDIPQYRQSIQAGKTSEIDMLYKNFQRSVRKPSVKNTPGVYLGVGFVLGAVSMLIISLIVGVSSMAMRPKQQDIEKIKPTSVAIIPADKKLVAPPEAFNEEKYTIKSGDTLDKIAFRFYGKYDNEKIEKIQALNQIKNPSALQIGQVILIPLDR